MRMLSPDIGSGIKAFIAVVRSCRTSGPEKAADEGKTHFEPKPARRTGRSGPGFYATVACVLREIVQG